MCLEEGVTTTKNFAPGDNSKLFELILPVLPGCREVQLAYNGFAGQGVTSADSDSDLYCFQSSGSTVLSTAVIGRFFFFLHFSFSRSFRFFLSFSFCLISSIFQDSFL